MDSSTVDRHQQTRNRVFRLLYDSDESYTKQQVATELSLSLPTVHQSLAELDGEGLICAAGQEQSTGGRPATRIAIEANARIAIGVQATEHHFRIIATNLRREELATKTLRHEPTTSASELGTMLAKEVETFIDEAGLDRTHLLGVGVAIAGTIDQETDTISHAPTLNMSGASLADIRERIPYPTTIGNDANLGGFAEWYMRPNPGNIAYLSLESGVGGAVLLEGSTYLGDNGRSGEFGHICVERGGRTCACGKKGCLEAYCSTRRLSDDLGITLEEFFGRLDSGDKDAERVWADYITHLAAGIETIRMALDCDVVIGGGIVHYLTPRLAQIREQVAALDTFGGDASYVTLSHLFRHATQLGAALVCIDEFARSV